MTTEQGSFERESRLYPARAYKGIVSIVEKVIAPDGVDLPELIGQSGKHYTVLQTTTSKEHGDHFDSKKITINTETEYWTVSKGTGTDHESMTDRLSYSRIEEEQNLELGLWGHGESWRHSGINVNVFGKFDELLRDLEPPLQEPPLSWYGAIAFHKNEEGIRLVLVGSSEFVRLEDGEVHRLMNEWGHSVDLEGHLRPGVNEEEISQAESFIKEKTGFSPKQIRDHAHKLEQIYKGKQSAPFDINWVE